MSFTPGDKVRLVKHPTVIGTYISGTRSAHIVKFDFTDPYFSGTYVRSDAIEPVPPQYTWDDVKGGDLVTVSSVCGTLATFTAQLFTEAPTSKAIWADWEIVSVQRPVTTYEVVEPGSQSVSDDHVLSMCGLGGRA
jgi:hypothetical protein